MITTCWRLSSFSLYLNWETPSSRAVIKHHTELAATCQQYRYTFFPLTPAARSASKTHGCEVWIMGERRDPIPGGFVELAEEIIAFIWNGHSAFIWVNGAEGEIFSRRLTLCQHVEKGWLPENKNSCETNPVWKCWRAQTDGLIASSGNTPVNYARQLFFFPPFPSSPANRPRGGGKLF